MDKLFRSLLLLGLALVSLPSSSAEPKRPPNYHHDVMPETSFNCEEKVVGGYYADIDAGCQMFHVCVQVDEVEIRDFKFMCPNDTVFDQENFICANWFDVDCSLSAKWYPNNKNGNGRGGTTESPYEQYRRAQLKQREKLQEIQDEQTGRLKEHEKFLKEQQRAVAAQQQKTLKEYERQNTETLKEQLRQLQKQQEHLEEIDQRPVGRKVPSRQKDNKTYDYYPDASSTTDYDYYYYDYDYTEEPGRFYKNDEYDPDGRIVEPVETVPELPVIVPASSKKSNSGAQSKSSSSSSKSSASSDSPKSSSGSKSSSSNSSKSSSSKTITTTVKPSSTSSKSSKKSKSSEKSKQ